MLKIWKFILRHVEFPIFAFLLLFKMYLFAKEVELHFVNKHLIYVSLGTIILYLCVALLFQRRLKFFVLSTLYIIASLIIYADLIYYRYFGDFITTPVLLQVGQASDISASIWQLMGKTDLLYVVDFIFVAIGFVYFISRKRRGNFHIRLVERVTLFSIALAFGLFLVIHPLQNYTQRFGDGFLKNMWSNESVYKATGHLGFHAFETTKYIKENIFERTPLTKEEKEDVFITVNSQQREPNMEWFGKASGKNVLIIQLESFQNFVIGKKINNQEITPNLNDLIDETMYFSSFYHQTGQGRTSDAEFLTNTSLYPLSSGSVYVRYPNNEYDALPLILREKGYMTRAYHAYDETFWNRAGIYRTFQFDDFIGKDDLFSRTKVEALFSSFETMGDEQLFQESLEDLKKTKQPVYHFIVALTSHHPYRPMPQEELTLNVAPFEEDIFGHYLQSIHYVDRAVGTLVKELKESGLWEETVVVLYGDHDNGVTWKQEYANAIEGDLEQLNSYQTLKNVPLFVHIPGNDELGEFHHSVGMIDVTPSILELLGIEGKYMHLGQSIFDMSDHIVPFRDGSSIKGNVLSNGETCMDEACRALRAAGKKLLQVSDHIIYHNLRKE